MMSFNFLRCFVVAISFLTAMPGFSESEHEQQLSLVKLKTDSLYVDLKNLLTQLGSPRHLQQEPEMVGELHVQRLLIGLSKQSELERLLLAKMEDGDAVQELDMKIEEKNKVVNCPLEKAQSMFPQNRFEHLDRVPVIKTKASLILQRTSPSSVPRHRKIAVRGGGVIPAQGGIQDNLKNSSDF